MESGRGDNMTNSNGVKTDDSTNDVDEQQPSPIDFSPQAAANINLTNFLDNIGKSLSRTCDLIMSKMDDLERRVGDMEQNLKELIEESVDEDELKLNTGDKEDVGKVGDKKNGADDQ